MKFTLLGGVKKQFNKFRVKVKKYLTKERLIALSLLSRAFGIVILSVIIPWNAYQANAKNQISTSNEVKGYLSNVHLDLQNYQPIKLEAKTLPQIAMGESEHERQEREKREAEESKLAYTRDVYARETERVVVAPVDPDLSAKRALVKKAAAKYGIDWKILEAVWQVESGKSWDTSTASYAGAQGPMQFMPGTWAAYGQDGNGDGVSDINKAEDALYGGANYLAAGGASSGNIDQALFNYNHAQWYVDKVKGVADSITE